MAKICYKALLSVFPMVKDKCVDDKCRITNSPASADADVARKIDRI